VKEYIKSMDVAVYLNKLIKEQEELLVNMVNSYSNELSSLKTFLSNMEIMQKHEFSQQI
jgi:hypothetical protein